MLAPEDKEEIRDEIIKILMDKSVMKEVNSIAENKEAGYSERISMFSNTRNKWFKQKGKMLEVTDSISSYKVWESIRRVVCIICGEKRVAQLTGKEEFAEYAANILLQTCYNLIKEYKEYEEYDKDK